MYKVITAAPNRYAKRSVLKEIADIETKLLRVEIKFLKALFSDEYDLVSYASMYVKFLEEYNKTLGYIMSKNKPRYTIWNKNYFSSLYASVV